MPIALPHAAPGETRLFNPSTGARLYLTPQERSDFLTTAQALHETNKLSGALLSLCMTLLSTGARPHEIVQATFDDLLPGLHFRLRTAKQRGKRANSIYRNVPIPQSCASAIQAVFAGHSPRYQLWPYTTRYVHKIVAKVMRAGGIAGEHASPKGLRHGFGVALALQRVPVNVIQKAMGHASINNTMAYLQIVGEEQAQLIALAHEGLPSIRIRVK